MLGHRCVGKPVDPAIDHFAKSALAEAAKVGSKNSCCGKVARAQRPLSCEAQQGVGRAASLWHKAWARFMILSMPFSWIARLLIVACLLVFACGSEPKPPPGDHPPPGRAVARAGSAPAEQPAAQPNGDESATATAPPTRRVTARAVPPDVDPLDGVLAELVRQQRELAALPAGRATADGADTTRLVGASRQRVAAALQPYAHCSQERNGAFRLVPCASSDDWMISFYRLPAGWDGGGRELQLRFEAGRCVGATWLHSQ